MTSCNLSGGTFPVGSSPWIQVFLYLQDPSLRAHQEVQAGPKQTPLVCVSFLRLVGAFSLLTGGPGELSPFSPGGPGTPGFPLLPWTGMRCPGKRVTTETGVRTVFRAAPPRSKGLVPSHRMRVASSHLWPGGPSSRFSYRSSCSCRPRVSLATTPMLGWCLRAPPEHQPHKARNRCLTFCPGKPRPGTPGGPITPGVPGSP